MLMQEHEYLADFPDGLEQHGFSKVLLVRKLSIHLKHIYTEIFVRKTVKIDDKLKYLGLDLFRYVEILTNRLRKIYKVTRIYTVNCKSVITREFSKFFPFLEILNGIDHVIVLDFDGVVTTNNFRELYELCIQRSKVIICSANPTIVEEWFDNTGRSRPNIIYSMKGKKKKIKKLIEIQKTYDVVLYIDNETEYLDYAWIFGIYTYHWTNNKIINYSHNSR